MGSKKPERQQAFLSGEHEPKELSKIIQQFIHEVILCPKCHLPEIVMQVDEGGRKVMGKCRACGGFNELRITNEKFKRYILNHPPTTKGGSFSGSVDIKEKEAAVKNKVTKQNERDKNEKEKEGKSNDKKIEEGDDNNVVWYSDTSDDAARARREKMLPDALPKSPKKLPDIIEVKTAIKSIEKLQELKSNHGLSNGEFVPLIFETLVPKDSTSFSPIIDNKVTMKEFVDEEGQTALLQCIEKFCGETQPSLIPKVARIIKEIYDEELLDEETILSWFEDSTNANSKVRENISPLIKWFKETTESDGDE